MNIFVLDLDIRKSARYQNDRHAVKMLLESVQILSTVANSLGGHSPYKPTHHNHPCTKWAATSFDNYQWLYEYVIEMNIEWKYRFNHAHNHKSYETMQTMKHPIKSAFPSIGPTPFALAMPEAYQSTDPVQSYRKYYKAEKRHIANWKNRPVPEWWE